MKKLLFTALLAAFSLAGWADDPVRIGTAEELQNFASRVNSGETTLNALLTANIVTDNTYTPIGTRSNKYAGTFDGGGYSVELNINKESLGNVDAAKLQGLFGCAGGGATIKNVIVKGSVITAANCTAALIGEVNGSNVTVKIINVGCEATVKGNSYVGAFVGNNNGTNPRVTLQIENCYNTGSVTASSNAAIICGYMPGTYNNTYTNVYNTYNLRFVSGNYGTFTNCYTTNTESATITGLTQTLSTSKVATGELCYLLNGSTVSGNGWYQTIGTDTHPVFSSASSAVSAVNTGCFTNLTVSPEGMVQIGSDADMAKFAAEIAMLTQK